MVLNSFLQTVQHEQTTPHSGLTRTLILLDKGRGTLIYILSLHTCVHTSEYSGTSKRTLWIAEMLHCLFHNHRNKVRTSLKSPCAHYAIVLRILCSETCVNDHLHSEITGLKRPFSHVWMAVFLLDHLYYYDCFLWAHKVWSRNTGFIALYTCMPMHTAYVPCPV